MWPFPQPSVQKPASLIIWGILLTMDLAASTSAKVSTCMHVLEEHLFQSEKCATELPAVQTFHQMNIFCTSRVLCRPRLRGDDPEVQQLKRCSERVCCTVVNTVLSQLFLDILNMYFVFFICFLCSIVHKIWIYEIWKSSEDAHWSVQR